MLGEPCLLQETAQNPSPDPRLALCPNLSWAISLFGMKRAGCYWPHTQQDRLTHSSEEQDKEQGAQHQCCVPYPLGGVHS